MAGQELVRGEIRHPRLANLELAGRCVSNVHPVGKHLLLRFGDGHTLHSHLRMDGAWHLYSPGSRWRAPATQVRAVLATAERIAVGIRLHDLRWIPTSRESELIGHLGPDPLAADFAEEDLAEVTRRLGSDPAREIGSALLDQRNIAGVGNLYQTEVCFQLGRTPWTPASDVDRSMASHWCHRLLTRNAWHPEQSTTGSMRRGDQHWVYQRRQCRRCGTTVLRGTLGPDARLTYYCPRCQPGPAPT